MSEDRLHDQISKGRQAVALEGPLRLAVDRFKDSLVKYMLGACKADELEYARRIYHATDQIGAALQNIIADGKVAERELQNIEQGRHRIYNVA
jgi:hypothetical protein